MTTVTEDASAELQRRIAELERRLEAALIERDAAIDRQTASALVNFRLQSELRDALDREKAGAEILRSIAATAGDAGHALHTIAETTLHFFNAASVTIRVAEGDEWVQTVRVGASAQLTGAQPSSQLATRGANLPATVYQENRQIHIPDLDHLDPSMADWPAAAARAAGIRTICGTPLRRDGRAIGALLVYRDRLAPFTDEELALQQSFADQALIAIENARLFNEAQEALARQTATSDILRVISQSPTDVQPVFDSIVQTAVRLLGCETAFILRCDSVHFWAVARCRREEGLLPAMGAPFAPSGAPIDPGANFPSRVIVDKTTLHLPDWSQIELPEFERRIQEVAGYQSAVYLPLLREEECIGVLGIAGSRPHMFGETAIALAESFCDQAVIAIENTRLFNETQEALARQTATSDILRVISASPTDVQPVFDAIVQTAVRLLGCETAFIQRCDGEHFWSVARCRPEGLVPVVAPQRLRIDRDANFPSRAIVDKKTLHLPDWSQIEIPEFERRIQQQLGYQSAVYLPLLREGECVGVLGIAGSRPRMFDQTAIVLAESFCDQAVIAIENTRLFNETQEALERQTATADILKVIASSPSDVQPVFEAIAASAKRLIGGFSSAVLRFVDGMTQLEAFTPIAPAADEVLRSSFPRPLGGIFKLAQEGKPAQIPDTQQSPYLDPEISRARGFRSMLLAPLMNKGVPIGMINVTRTEAGSFADHHVQLLKTFADQAVIAIENTRLFNETQEALERQTATADILKVIASSPSDVQPVFDAIVNSGALLFEPCAATITTLRDGKLHWNATAARLPGFDVARARAIYPIPFDPERSPSARAILERRVIEIPDIESPDTPEFTRNAAAAGGFRSIVFVPLVDQDQGIGTIIFTHPQAGFKFTDKQLALVQTFADQAVIAIKNTRLFNEVQAKTRDLEEALKYQTGSANILNVIASSPTDVAPVLKAIVECACELCDAYDAVVGLKDGDELRLSAHHGPIPISFSKRPINRNWTAGRAFIDQKAVHVHDMLAEQDEFPDGQELARRVGHRSIVSVPLLREGESIGVIILRRAEVHPFSDKQIALLQTFADQAVIAIDNARLFDEVQAKTRDLEESLQQQIATSEVLQVISSKPGELGPVFQSMLENATRICSANFGALNLFDGEAFTPVAHFNTPPEFSAVRLGTRFRPHPESGHGKVARHKEVVHIADLRESRAYRDGSPSVVSMTDVAGARTIVIVPMLKEAELIGTLAIYRQEVRPFNDKQIALLSNFANQAVIAIENTRLLKELHQRTEDLTHSLDDLRTAQDRLIQTEKLASLGQLTAGIAHEIKNPLNFVNNFAALSAELTDELRTSLKPAVLDETIRAEVDELTGMLKDNLGKVVQHGKRADSIVKNMLLHSREGSGEHRPADINALVDESLNLAYHGARAEKPHFNVTLKRDFDPQAGMADVFPQEITRVFLNLISNGFYAVAKRKSEHGDAAFEPQVIASTRGSTDHVEVRIRDNGTGIPPEVKERMFNPFFTTKPAGEGTGLGLSMSHDIVVKQHGGTIDVDTLPGEFTEFTIVLPRTSNHSNKTRG